MDFVKLNDIIKSAGNILIISHINPDGDTLGAMCGLYNGIKENFKKNCDMAVLSKIPEVYKFLPNILSAKHIDNIDKSLVYDVVICVDIAACNRFEPAEILFNKANFSINIDHHKTNTKYADLNIIDANASSAGELLYNIMKSLNWKINTKTAVCLYTALLTDTGSFRFGNTTPATFKAAAELAASGIDTVEIYKNCYETNSKNLVMFQAYCISNAKFSDNDKIVYSIIYKKDIERFSAGEDCTEGLAEKLRSIDTTKIAFIVRQISTKISKVSMRSKDIDVSEICAAFGGGGHSAAAGCVIQAAPDRAAEKILNEIRKRDLL